MDNIRNITRNTTKRTPKSLLGWSWIGILLFFALSFVDIRFALLGFLCMAAPITFALLGKGKVHCSHYCPRGSFFGRFLKSISLNHTLPRFMCTKAFKNGLLAFMAGAFAFCLYRMGFGYDRIAATLLRMMLVSFAAGTIMGIYYMPRSWCKVCPMGHAAGLIRDRKAA